MHYTPHAIKQILNSHRPQWVKKDGNYILNEAISFDIETTSMKRDETKYAFMYVWMLDIYDCTIIGRTWAEFVYVMNEITMHFHLSDTKRRCIVYVHNLAYEFQFIRKWFKWVKVFSLSRRKPLYAVTTTGIEFRCSYKLSGYKLEKVGEQMGIEKLPDFDYSKIRHSRTHLTPREYEYCIHDVKIVSAYIRQKMKEEGNNIAEIPLTKTGYVRRYVRNATLKGKNRCFYINAIKSLTLEPEEYLMAKKAFAGGFTHTGFLHSGIERKNVTSFDFSSSYPTVLIAEKYPMTKGEHIENITYEDFFDLMSREECCIFTIELLNLQQIFPCESYISESRCTEIEGYDADHPPIINNGRVVSAKRIVIDITTIDYNIISKVYQFIPNRIGHLYHYKKYYLPTTFVECILKFYNDKTKLKDIQEKLVEYMAGKENLNALFGMCVTDIVREIINYDNKVGWGDNRHQRKTKEEAEREKEEYKEFVSNQVDKENNKKSRFLFYLWGVFCTAYARKNLWSGILECKSDYIYSDTDSVKILNYENHKQYFENYNKEILAKLETALDYHHLPHELIYPQNIKGKTKPLGIWDFDGFYERFKAIRAKSYMYYSDGDYHMTVAGLSKRDRTKPLTPDTKLDAVDYLKTQDAIDDFHKFHDTPENPDPMDMFIDGMRIPSKYTGKLTHTYIDEPFSIQVEDFQGNLMTVHEQSCIHLEPTEFRMTRAEAYSKFLKGIQQDVYE